MPEDIELEMESVVIGRVLLKDLEQTKSRYPIPRESGIRFLNQRAPLLSTLPPNTLRSTSRACLKCSTLIYMLRKRNPRLRHRRIRGRFCPAGSLSSETTSQGAGNCHVYNGFVRRDSR